MKFLKYISVLSIMFLWSTISLGHKFTFSNVTERMLVICYKLESLSQPYYQILPPEQSISHYFPNLHCFGGSILWAELKEKDVFGNALPFRGGIDLLNQESGELIQDIFETTLANKYAFIPMQIKVVSNETFELTARAAQELMEGVDVLSCGIINTTLKFMNPLPGTSQNGKTENPPKIMPTNTPTLNGTTPSIANCRFGLGQLAKGGADLAGITLCRDLHFLIVDTGEIGSPAPTKEGVIVSRVKKPVLIAEINQGG